MKKTTSITGALLALLASAALGAAWVSAQVQGERSLYQRLGGLDGVATLVDQLVDRMAADEVLQANPYVHEAMTRVSRAGLKYRITTMLCASTGGPQPYAGRSMRDAHAHLRITGHEWRAFHLLFVATLDACAVAEPERGELLAVVDAAEDGVVVAGELDGRRFVGERGASGQQAGSPDEVSFADGRLVSQADAGAGVAAAIYAATVGDKATTFEAESSGRDGATVAWKGTVKGDALEARISVSKPGGPAHKSWFRGRVTP
jgi:hemoglobin